MGLMLENSLSVVPTSWTAPWTAQGIADEWQAWAEATLAQDAAKIQALGEGIVALVADRPEGDFLLCIAGRALLYTHLFALAFLVYGESNWLDWIAKSKYAVCLWKATGDVAVAAALLQAAQADQRAQGGQPDVSMLPVCRMNGVDTVPAFVAVLQ